MNSKSKIYSRVAKSSLAIFGAYAATRLVSDMMGLLIGAFALYGLVEAIYLKMAGLKVERKSISYAKALMFSGSLTLVASYDFQAEWIAIAAGLMIWIVDLVYAALDKIADWVSVQLERNSVSNWQIQTARTILVALAVSAAFAQMNDHFSAGFAAGFFYWVADAVTKRITTYRIGHYTKLEIRISFVIVGVWALGASIFQGLVAIAITTGLLCWMVDTLPEKLKLGKLFDRP